jgi:hypothetical protein
MTARAKLTKVEPAAPEAERPEPTVTLSLHEVGRLFGCNSVPSPMVLATAGLERLSQETWLLVGALESGAGDVQTLAGQLAERAEELSDVLYKFEKAEEEASP